MWYCEQLRHVVEDFDGPFRMLFDIVEVHTFNLTPSKKAVSMKGRDRFGLVYCPFCGARIDEEQPCSASS